MRKGRVSGLVVRGTTVGDLILRGRIVVSVDIFINGHCIYIIYSLSHQYDLIDIVLFFKKRAYRM